MLLEIVITGVVIYYALRRLVRNKLSPYGIAEAIGGAKETATKTLDGVRRAMTSRAQWERSRATQRAQALYDQTVVEVFAKATNEEKQTLLALFAKYAPAEE